MSSPRRSTTASGTDPGNMHPLADTGFPRTTAEAAQGTSVITGTSAREAAAAIVHRVATMVDTVLHLGPNHPTTDHAESSTSAANPPIVTVTGASSNGEKQQQPIEVISDDDPESATTGSGSRPFTQDEQDLLANPLPPTWLAQSSAALASTATSALHAAESVVSDAESAAARTAHSLASTAASTAHSIAATATSTASTALGGIEHLAMAGASRALEIFESGVEEVLGQVVRPAQEAAHESAQSTASDAETVAQAVEGAERRVADAGSMARDSVSSGVAAAKGTAAAGVQAAESAARDVANYGIAAKDAARDAIESSAATAKDTAAAGIRAIGDAMQDAAAKGSAAKDTAAAGVRAVGDTIHDAAISGRNRAASWSDEGMAAAGEKLREFFEGSAAATTTAIPAPVNEEEEVEGEEDELVLTPANVTTPSIDIDTGRTKAAPTSAAQVVGADQDVYEEASSSSISSVSPRASPIINVTAPEDALQAGDVWPGDLAATTTAATRNDDSPKGSSHSKGGKARVDAVRGAYHHHYRHHGGIDAPPSTPVAHSATASPVQSATVPVQSTPEGWSAKRTATRGDAAESASSSRTSSTTLPLPLLAEAIDRGEKPSFAEVAATVTEGGGKQHQQTPEEAAMAQVEE